MHQAQAEALPQSASSIDREAPASIIAAKFGGINAFARAMDKAPSTVHRWIVSGFIPAKQSSAVMAAAKERRIKLRPEDFIARQ